MLDALAHQVGPDRAPEMLRRSLIGTPVPPADGDVSDLATYVHDELGPRLHRELGAEASDVMIVAQALLAPLCHDALAEGATPFRAPYVLVSDAPNTLEGVIEMRRVTTLLDALLELDATPDATLVVDATCTHVSLVGLALAASDLPTGTQIVIVGATEAARAEHDAVARRAATFVDRFLPLDLPVRRRAAGRSVRGS